MDKNYESLIVWQKSMDLVVEIYKITDEFPKSELYGLTSQMRRASVSIPSNIAEGSRRYGNPETKKYLSVSFSSGAELETQIKISKRLNFSHSDKFNIADTLLEEIMKILNKMIGNLRAR
jgi:four helix bundle protein